MTINYDFRVGDMVWFNGSAHTILSLTNAYSETAYELNNCEGYLVKRSYLRRVVPHSLTDTHIFVMRGIRQIDHWLTHKSNSEYLDLASELRRWGYIDYLNIDKCELTQVGKKTLEKCKTPTYRFKIGDKVKCHNKKEGIVVQFIGDGLNNPCSNMYLIYFDDLKYSRPWSEDNLKLAEEVVKEDKWKYSTREFSIGEEVLIKTGKYSGRKGIVRGKYRNGIMEYYIEAHYPGRNPNGEDNIVLFSNDMEAIDKETEARGIRFGSDHELDETHYYILHRILEDPELRNHINTIAVDELEQWGYIERSDCAYILLTEIGKQALKERK